MNEHQPVQRAFHSLRDKGGFIATIALSETDGQWFFAIGHQQRGGDCWGSWGLNNRKPFASEADALAGAVAHARNRWTGRERDMADHFAWLDTLIPEQPDLFTGARNV